MIKPEDVPNEVVEAAVVMRDRDGVINRLTAEVEMLKTSGICEVAASNRGVMR